MNTYIICVFKKKQLQPVCEIKITGSLKINPKKFAHLHGGDYIEILTLQDYEEIFGYQYST